MTAAELSFLEEKLYQAERAGSYLSLLAYPRALFSWQRSHPKDVKAIAMISSHMHGYTHYRCEKPTLSHPKPHELCKDKCEAIDFFLREQLTITLVNVIKNVYDSTIQTHLDLPVYEETKKQQTQITSSVHHDLSGKDAITTTHSQTTTETQRQGG